jgi:hypothetical protein
MKKQFLVKQTASVRHGLNGYPLRLRPQRTRVDITNSLFGSTFTSVLRSPKSVGGCLSVALKPP